MISAPFAHVAGIPIEETLGTVGPALLLATGVASAWLGARIRHLRARKPRRGAVDHAASPVKQAADGPPQ